MDARPSNLPSTAVAKPLLLDAIGKPLLAYLLGASEELIEQWLIGSSDTFGSEHQAQALAQFVELLDNAPIGDHPIARRLDLERILGLYFEPQGTTLANAVRNIATGQTRARELEPDASIEAVLVRLTQDSYPLFLLPQTDKFSSTGIHSLSPHPAQEQFNAEVMGDMWFSAMFAGQDKHMGVFGYTLRSTGKYDSVQLSMFAPTLIGNGWRLAEMSNTSLPTIDEHVQATLSQLNDVRRAVQGEVVKVPVRIGFTGVLLHSMEPVDLGWGVLRRADEREQRLAPDSLDGQVGGTRADGSSVTVNYRGDVVLEATIDYQIVLTEHNFDEEWPQRLRAYERVGRLIESIQLGALLSEEYDLVEPIMVLPTWHYIHDPLLTGYSISWNDPRQARAFMPKQLSEVEEANWLRFASAIDNYRTDNIDVAIRRTLRASSERKELSDVLVDTVIVWENLFGSRHGEPTLRVSSSLARLLESDFVKRKKLRTELTAIYNTRSDIVHGNRQPPARELIDKSHRALEITVKTLRLLFTERLDLLKECKGGDERSLMLLMKD